MSPSEDGGSLSAEQTRLLGYYEESVIVQNKKMRSAGDKAIRHIVRTHVWSTTKFLTGEGCGRVMKHCTPTLGKSHERPDLTQSSENVGYPCVILDYCGQKDKPLKDRARYWKTWESIVRHEIQVKRANVMKKVKDTLNESKYVDLYALSYIECV